MIDYTNFEKFLRNLGEMYHFYKNKNWQVKDHTSLEQQRRTEEAFTESVIQRFEICYDCLWKILKLYLKEEFGITKLSTAPKSICRVAFENDVLVSSVEQWFKYIEVRIGTTHDYSGEKAKKAIEIVDDFINDAIELYQTMTKKTWKSC